jgi:hypothetical protein
MLFKVQVSVQFRSEFGFDFRYLTVPSIVGEKSLLTQYDIAAKSLDKFKVNALK